MSRPLFRRLIPPRLPDQLDDELRFHLEMRAAEYRSLGISESEARALAVARMGDVNAARKECLTIGYRSEKRMTRTRVLDQLSQDVRFALRGLGRQKGWTATALLTLALGIGATTAVFSVVNSLLLHPVPYPDGERVVLIHVSPTNNTGVRVTMGPPMDQVTAWRGHARSFDAIEPYSTTDMTLLEKGTPALIHAAAITPTFLAFAGQHVLAGRGFTKEDAGIGAPPVVLLNEVLWNGRYGRNPKVIGQAVTLDGRSYTVIGIMPRTLQVMGFGVTMPDVWLPFNTDPIPGRQEMNPNAIGRLRQGVTIAAARSELDMLAQIAKAPSAKNFSATLIRPVELVNFASSLWLLAGAATLVLLIACANVAHLMLARGGTRERELAIRVALGAGRARLSRQLLTESLVLAAAGCVGGIALGWAGLQGLLAVRPDGLAELDGAHIDATVVLAGIGLSLLTGIAFGLSAVVQFAVRTPHAALKAGATATSGTRGQHRVRSLLVITEMALSATLLVGATLLVRSVIKLQGADLGFAAADLYAVRGRAPVDQSKTVNLQDAEDLAVRLRRIPGVEAVTLSHSMPPGTSVMFTTLRAENGADVPPSPFVQFNLVRPEYFAFMQIHLMAGGTFTDATVSSTQVIVNEGLAKKYWPSESAVGHRIRLGADEPWLTIVGVTADVAIGGATSDRSSPMIYLAKFETPQVTYLVRARPGINPLPPIRALLTSIDPQAAPPALISISAAMDQRLARPRFTMLLLTAFTIMAIILAAIGLYGVLAYAVTQRTREIGIRMALGATRTDVLVSVVGRGIGLAVIGAAAGLIASHWATGAIEKMLYGVQRTDTASFAIGTTVLLVTAVIACVVPARRAVAIDPVSAIRAE